MYINLIHHHPNSYPIKNVKVNWEVQLLKVQKNMQTYPKN